MNVYDPYPSSVEVNGEEIPLDLAYDHVLMALDVLSMCEMTMPDRIETACILLLKYPDIHLPRDLGGMSELLNAIFALFPKNTEQKEKVIDFHQDAAMIRSAFFRIGVDLTKDKINFFQFLELLADLPKDTALMRVIDIRTRPLPMVTNENREQVAELQRMKQKVAIKLSEEEMMRNFAKTLRNSSLLRG